jgi:hypothetical protein
MVNYQQNTETEGIILTQSLIDAGRVIGLGINIEKNKYTLLSHQENTGQNDDIRSANSLKICHSSSIWEQE